ncbi:MAG: 3-deoxy-D-manno-octulosonic acid transferase [Candidatus Omnitrophica bacterium]|nr:3-deoxy-D-manno-octulosonic acid transferase [Candidatus Omnitrophota bacterium]
MSRRTRGHKSPKPNFLSPYFYNTAFLLFGLFYLPIFLLKIKQSANPKRLIKQRLGIFSWNRRQKFLTKRVIWIHAVSVGEVMAARKFIQGFLKALPHYHIVLTTVTPTGQKVARELKCERVSVRYFPFDLTWSVHQFFEALRPECILLMETELWPNLLSEAAWRGIPVGILNGRLSIKSEKRYRRFLPLTGPLFQRLTFVLAQTEEDAKRFESLGLSPNRIRVLGNMKFDNLPASDDRAPAILRKEWGFQPEDKILIAGSTHPGEEKILMKTFMDLKAEFPTLKMIVAPRHIERSESILVLLTGNSLRAVLAYEEHLRKNFDILILNRIGVLKNLYQLADIVFMGGSLVKHGGQNPIEPACFKKPMIHGPHIFNFGSMYRSLDQEHGAISVTDADHLTSTVKNLLKNAYECQTLGKNAFSVIERLQGATERHLDWVREFLSPQSLEREKNDSSSNQLSEVSSRRT